MGAEENKAVVRRLVDEFLNKRNVDVVDEIFAEDFVDHQGGLAPTGDRASVKQFVEAITAAFPDVRFEIDHLVAEDDRVFALVSVQGTHTGDFQGVAATGRPIAFAGMTVMRLADGKIAERWNITDFAGLMRQIAP